MKGGYHSQSCNLKAKFSPCSSALDLKPISMGKNRGTPSKTEMKRNLVALRLAMIQKDIDAISNEDQLPPDPPLEPLTPIKPVTRKSKCKSSAMERAKEVQANLPAEHPCLIRRMLHSHTTSGFWLGISSKFCDQHLPISDTWMEFIDESGESFNVKYLASKTAFSGGWRGFAIAHNLKAGDVVVFELVQKATIKVYIMRCNVLDETDGAEDLDASVDEMISNDGGKDDGNVCERAQEQHPDSRSPASGAEEHEKMIPGSPDIDGLGSEMPDRVRRQQSKSTNLEGFEKFSIHLDGSVSIDDKFPDNTRRKYYDLCASQNSFLHEKLLKGLNCILVVGIIKEIINISDAIRARDCNVTAPQSDLIAWDRTLQSFEMVGMNVGFIRMQIHTLLGRTLEREEAAALEAEAESELAGEKMKALEAKFSEMRKRMEEINDEIEMIKGSTKRQRVKLQQMTGSSCSGFAPSLVD